MGHRGSLRRPPAALGSRRRPVGQRGWRPTRPPSCACSMARIRRWLTSDWRWVTSWSHEAIADPALASLINVLMREEAARSFEPAPGQDLEAYADLLLARFANRARPHRLRQIAMDGSQKIPQRWLDTLRSCASPGPVLCGAAAGAWRLDRLRARRPRSPSRIRPRRSWPRCGANTAWRASPGPCSAPAAVSRSGGASAAELATLTSGLQGVPADLAAHVFQFHALGLMHHGAHEEERHQGGGGIEAVGDHQAQMRRPSSGS